MKGSPEAPQCGFSRTVCTLMEMHGVPDDKLETFNVLQDMDVREGIKEYR